MNSKILLIIIFDRFTNDPSFIPIERTMMSKEQKTQQKERQIDQMSAEAVLNELKDKRLPTYGTGAERKDRLKKQYGILPKSKSQIQALTTATNAGSVVEIQNNHL